MRSSLISQRDQYSLMMNLHYADLYSYSGYNHLIRPEFIINQSCETISPCFRIAQENDGLHTRWKTKKTSRWNIFIKRRSLNDS